VGAEQRIRVEANNGGEMVRLTIAAVDQTVPVVLVNASRGKHTRAEPIAAVYETGRIHHVGVFPTLESEMVLWTPGDASPNRLDAMVWGFSYLNMTRQQPPALTAQEKFELTLPETLRLTAIESERNPDRIERLIHSREIVIRQQASERAVSQPSIRRRNRLAAYRKLTRGSI
jgi:Terminase RNaseH-like domain